MATDPIKLQLRLPPELHGRLAAARGDSGRSLNTEIVERIEASFAADDKIKQLESVIGSLTAASKSHEEVIDTQRWHVQKLGDILRAIVMVARSSTPDTSEKLIATAKRYGDAIAATNSGESMDALRDMLTMIEREIGLLNSKKRSDA